MGSGNCSFWAPGVFDLDDEGVAVVVDATAAPEEKIILAMQGCPTQAIRLTRDGAPISSLTLVSGSGSIRTMSIGVSEEHGELARGARRWAEAHCPPSEPRSWLDGQGPMRPRFWAALSALGWLGLHLDADHGGEGYGVDEMVVVLEELGRVCAPGPFLPTVLAAAMLEAGGATGELADILAGRRTAAVAFAGSRQVLAGGSPDLILVAGADDTWWV